MKHSSWKKLETFCLRSKRNENLAGWIKNVRNKNEEIVEKASREVWTGQFLSAGYVGGHMAKKGRWVKWQRNVIEKEVELSKPQ